MKIAVAKQAKSEIRHIFAASWPRQGSLQGSLQGLLVVIG
jgi:hypothetical protein